MTYEEAKEWLPAIAKKYIHGGDSRFDARRLKAIDVAIEALDRRILKTPKTYREHGRQPDYLCPTCDADVDHEWDCCAGCGQALNWEGN